MKIWDGATDVRVFFVIFFKVHHDQRYSFKKKKNNWKSEPHSCEFNSMVDYVNHIRAVIFTEELNDQAKTKKHEWNLIRKYGLVYEFGCILKCYMTYTGENKNIVGWFY